MRAIFLIAGIMVGLPGCSQEGAVEYGATPDIAGYVTEKTDDEILVVSPAAETLGKGDGEWTFHAAVCVTSPLTGIEVGEQVNVWFKGEVEEPYSEQAAAGKIETAESSMQETADKSEAEAVQEALKLFNQDDGIIAMLDASYNEINDEWIIRLKVIQDQSQTAHKVTSGRYTSRIMSYRCKIRSERG